LLAQRLITAAVAIPLVALVVWVGGALLAGVVALAAFIAVVEFATARASGRKPLALVAALAAAAPPLVSLAGEEYVLGAVVAGVIVLASAFVLSSDPGRDAQDLVWGVSTSLYFGLLAAYLVLLREDDNGRDLLFFTILTVWITDTGAYFVGRSIGRHKLRPVISPGKTMEGSAGSLVTGFIAVLVLNEVFGLGLALEHRIALGLLLPVVVMLGDLAESALKRSLSLKDSSGLVPGHGGVADRLDSLLFAGPAVYYYLKWIVL
jgi:phosphatidate cytidylyltransferase